MATNPHQASVHGKNLPISLKQTVEVARFIRGKSLNKARELLQDVIREKIAVPFKRYYKDVGHRKNLGPGRYPSKVSKEMILLIDSLEANALNKGLNVESLVIRRAIPNYASLPFKAGRFRGRKARRAHIQLIAEEVEPTKARKQTKPQEVKK